MIEKAYHEQQTSRLRGEVRELQDRLSAARNDKLDRKVSEEFWERRRTRSEDCSISYY